MFKIWQLFFVFFKLGLFSFGGGYAMLPLIYQDIQKIGIMDPTEFSNLVGISQMTPGPIAINAATYVGFKAAGIWGSIAATVAVSLPAFFLIIAVVHFMNRFKSNQPLQAALSGIRPATVGLIGSAFVFFADTTIFSSEAFMTMLGSRASLWASLGSILSLPALGIAAVAYLLSDRFKVDPILIIIGAGVVGAFVM